MLATSIGHYKYMLRKLASTSTIASSTAYQDVKAVKVLNAEDLMGKLSIWFTNEHHTKVSWCRVVQ
jgi:hypothetical protein